MNHNTARFFLAILVLSLAATACRHVEPRGAGGPEQAGGIREVAQLPEGNVIIVPAPSVGDPLLASYDAGVVNAVQKKWQDLLRSSVGKIQSNKDRIVVRFKLHPDGTVSEVKTVDGDTEPMAFWCEKAVTDAAPFQPWTQTMKAAMGTSREVNFTFRTRS